MELRKVITWTDVQGTNEQIKDYVEYYCGANNLYYSNLTINGKNVSFTTYSKASYEYLTKKLIREKYSQEDELKIHRETFNNPSNPEFTEYNNYIEDCKVQARAFIEERKKCYW